MAKVWFVTGSSRGFGRQFVETALSRGDQVTATARNVQSLTELSATFGDAVLTLPLDVTDKAAVSAAVKQAHGHFGQLDVVVNNAGYGLFGAVEELSETDLRDQIETNLFGALWVTQSVLPILREQGHGHIIQVSTVGGVTTFPNLGGYHASKWALEGLSETLAKEVASFGIKVTIVEPGLFSTDWAGSSAVHADPLPVYADLRAAIAASSKNAIPGNPAAVGNALLKIVDAEKPPLRVFFGSAPLHLIRAVYNQRLETWIEWASVSYEAQG